MAAADRADRAYQLRKEEENDAEPPVMSLERFANLHGLTTTGDVDAHIHAALRCRPTTKTFARSHARTLTRLQNERYATVVAYKAAIAAGQIREQTAKEALQAAARGHDDNPSVQAARRVLAKREARRAASS